MWAVDRVGITGANGSRFRSRACAALLALPLAPDPKLYLTDHSISYLLRTRLKEPYLPDSPPPTTADYPSVATEPLERDRAPKWQRRPEQRRREILDSALWVFGRFGYQRATLADVAERAGVSPGTVSHYFGSKSELFQEVIADHFMGFVAQEEALLAGSEGPVRPQLHQVLRRMWDHAWTPGILELMQVVQVEVAEFPESGRLLCRQLGERWRGLVGRILESGTRTGEFRALDPELAARAMSYTLLGIAQKVSTFSRFDPSMPDREVMWQTVLEMIDRFLLAELPCHDSPSCSGKEDQRD